jgi:hypothetical protein
MLLETMGLDNFVRKSKATSHFAREWAVKITVLGVEGPACNCQKIDLSVQQGREDSATVKAAAQGKDDIAVTDSQATIHGFLKGIFNIAHGAWTRWSVSTGEASKVKPRQELLAFARQAKSCAGWYPPYTVRKSTVASDPRRVEQTSPRREIGGVPVHCQIPWICGENYGAS